MRTLTTTILVTALLFLARIAHADDYTIEGSTAKGTVRIHNAAEAKKLQGVSRIVGNLMLENYDGADVAVLNNLTMIEGSLIINNSQLTSVAGFAGLERVYGIVWIFDNPRLADVAFPRLKGVEQAFTITDNKALTALPAAGLTIGEPIKKIKGSITITGNTALRAAAVDEFVKKCTVGGRVETARNGA